MTWGQPPPAAFMPTVSGARCRDGRWDAAGRSRWTAPARSHRVKCCGDPSAVPGQQKEPRTVRKPVSVVVSR